MKQLAKSRFMRNKSILGLLLLTLTSCNKPTDAEKIAGTWDVVSSDTGGGPSPIPLGAMQFKFEGTRVIFGRGTATLEQTFRLEDKSELKVIEFTGEPKDANRIGLYSLNGDTLFLCIPPSAKTPRPTSLIGTNTVPLLTLNRKR